MLYAIVALLVIIADQWVKYWVSMNISVGAAGPAVIPGFISLTNLHNDGCALGFLSGGGARIYFIVLTGVFTVAVIIALATRFINGPVSRWSIVMVTAGGLSNCIDRVINGYVQDMFKLELFNFPIFNVADIFITIFCVVFVLSILFERKPKDDYDDEFTGPDNEDSDRPVIMAEKPEKVKKSHKNRRNAPEAAPAPAPKSAPMPQSAPRLRHAPDNADPFAEWEKANARVEAQHRASPAAKVSGARPQYTKPAYTAPAAARPQSAPRPAAPAPRPAARPAANVPAARPVQRPAAPKAEAAPVEKPVMPEVEFPQTAAPAAPAQKPFEPQSFTPAADQSADFSLDDILNEFK